MAKRLLSIVALLAGILSFSVVNAQDGGHPPDPAVIKAVLQDASQIAGRQLAEADVNWQSFQFSDTMLNCLSPNLRSLPARLYGYTLNVDLETQQIYYVTHQDRLFRCTEKGPGPDIKIERSPDPDFPTAPPNALNIPERRQTVAETDQTIRHELALYGHGTFTTAAYSPDGTTLAIGGSLGIWLMDRDLQPVAHLPGDAFGVTKLAWSPSRQQIATMDHDYVVQLWDVPSGKVQTLEQLSLTKTGEYAYYPEGSISYSPDGMQLASTGRDGVVTIWDSASGKRLSSIKMDGEVRAVAWHKDGKRLAVGGSEGDKPDMPLVTIYDVKTAKSTAVFKLVAGEGETGPGYGMPAGPIEALQWFPDGSRLVIVPPMGQSVFPVAWNPETDKTEPIEVFIACGDVATGLSVAPDAQHYGVAMQSCESGAAWADMYTTGNLGGTVTIPGGYGTVAAIAWHFDGKHFVVVRGSHGLVLYDLSQINPETYSIPILKQSTFFGEVNDEIPERSDLYDGYQGPEWTVVNPDEYSNPTASPDNQWIAAYNDNSPDKSSAGPLLFDASTGETKRSLSLPPTLKLSEGRWPGFAWSTDSTRLSVTWYQDFTAVWDIHKEQPLFVTDKPVLCEWGAENSVLLCRDYQKNEGDAPGDLYVLDGQTGQRVRTLQPQFDGKIVWGPQKRSLLLIGKDNRIRIWDKTLSKQLQDIPGMAVTWNGDGSRLVVVEGPGLMTLYNTVTGKAVATLHGPEAAVKQTVFSPDDRFLATTSALGEIDIWDAATGARLLRLVGHHGSATAKWEADSTQLLSYGSDGTKRVWQISEK